MSHRPTTLDTYPVITLGHGKVTTNNTTLQDSNLFKAAMPSPQLDNINQVPRKVWMLVGYKRNDCQLLLFEMHTWTG